MNFPPASSSIAPLFIAMVLLIGCSSDPKKETNDVATSEKPRVIVSTDIGGTDPDDFQSMIHYLMYADKFQTEGLISSPYGSGRKEHIMQMIDLYEKDLPKLQQHANFPAPDILRAVTKQGAKDAAPAQGWDQPTEGSQWIIEKAKMDSDQPLWVLVWGGIEDVAQALHDAPEIAAKIRVYWIGGPNKKWSVHSYQYIARNFPDLWMIEANSTYRGWFLDADARPEMDNDNFYEHLVKHKGAFGADFGNYYKGSIKMGDTPTVAYLLNGDPDNPEGESWGGSFTPLPYGAVRNFEQQTTVADTVPTYSFMEWTFDTGEADGGENPEIWMEISRQRIRGFHEGNGVYKVRFVPQKIGKWEYVIGSTSKQLDGQKGAFVSANPWPGIENPDNIPLNNWWSDRTGEDLYIGEYQGAKTVSKWREDFLSDWAERFSWLEE